MALCHMRADFHPLLESSLFLGLFRRVRFQQYHFEVKKGLQRPAMPFWWAMNHELVRAVPDARGSWEKTELVLTGWPCIQQGWWTLLFFFQYPRPCTLLPGEVKLRWRNALFFFWDVSSQALQFACSLSLQAVQLLIGGGSIINQHKYIGLDSVPCKTASFMDVYLRVSAAWMLLCGAKAKSAFFWVQVHPWDWQTRTPIC